MLSIVKSHDKLVPIVSLFNWLATGSFGGSGSVTGLKSVESRTRILKVTCQASIVPRPTATAG